MSQDIEQYSDIIEQLKPVVGEPEFNQVLSQVASALPKPKRFLLKMELMRLAKPCKHAIDLRGHVDGECSPYEYEGITHHLDEVAVEVFERQIRSFGAYTLGVKETVTNTENNFRVMHQKQQQEDLKKKDAEASETEEPPVDLSEVFQANQVYFADYAQRSEERMNFSVAVEVFSEMEDALKAMTVDLSVRGLKIKLHKKHLFKTDERIMLFFRGLEKEYSLDKSEAIPYLITHIDRSRDEQRISLKRLFDKPTKTFDAFLERFIQGNKRRYKLNIDNTVDAILTKGYEQYYIPHFTSIPVYISQQNGQYVPRYALTNDTNQESIYFWADEQHHLRLGYLFPHQRIEALLKKPEGEQETYIYSFNHIKDGKSYYYSATLEELEANPKIKRAYLAYASRKASWRVYKLQLTDMNPEQCHQPLSLPDSVNDIVRRQNQPPAPRLMSRLKDLSHIALLTDITSDIGVKAYQKLKVERNMLVQLQTFAHPRNKPPENIGLYRFKYQNFRRETRFQLRTEVHITMGDLEFQGVTEDISPNGLRIELNNLYPASRHARLAITFPKLQAMTQKHVLKDIPYDVADISAERNVINLTAVTEEDAPSAKAFFEELIKNNRNKLKTDQIEEDIPGIGEAMRNIYAANLLNIPIFIKKEGVNFKPDAITTPKVENALIPLLNFKSHKGNMNLYPLYSAPGLQQDFIRNILRKLKTNSKPVMDELFIAFDPSQTEIQSAIQTQFADQFQSFNECRKFIAKALGAGRFYAIKIFIARTGRPDTELLRAEMNYVGAYASHRAKSLEEHLWSIAGVGDIVDVTDEVMLRHGFLKEHIIMNKMKAAPKEDEALPIS
ncbi:PilZ domain-containing protein [Alteromonadaceae bacterium M269]|nr:PilZ domain-containing protein [Alteromonadaceae bacterium M269]